MQFFNLQVFYIKQGEQIVDWKPIQACNDKLGD